MLKDRGRLLLSAIVFPAQATKLEGQLDDWMKAMVERAGPELAAELEIQIRKEYST